ncbi:MAG: GNAT family N-acetyltransferase [Phycisphaerae bacterium]|nr:GNAT family N-acetyltransferase [Phycisphaerae bacterium]
MDVCDILAIQQASLPESLLTLSGATYLTKVLYPLVLNHHNAKSYVLTVDKIVRGFAFYGNSPTFCSRELGRKKIQLMQAIITQFPRSPNLVLKYIQILRKSRMILDRDPGDSLFHLFLLAIAPQDQSKGLGSVLLNTSLKLAASEFALWQCLLETQTTQALCFYKKNGFEEIGYETRGSRRFVKMIRHLETD